VRYVYEICPLLTSHQRVYVVADNVAEAAEWWQTQGIWWTANVNKPLYRITELYRFRDFDHFIEVWILTTNCLRTEEDFRQVVVDYAAEAKRHGAVYLEAIFSPIERTWRGVSWDEIFTGYCDGAQEARELHGVEVRLTPDITRSAPLEDAHELVRHAARYRDRGIVAVGLGGEEAYYPNPPFAPAFREAKAAAARKRA
jgi:aminodeoxyfutalosine deaminase